MYLSNLFSNVLTLFEISCASKTHFDKVGMLRIADRNDSVNLFDQFLFFVVIKMHVPLRQACLPSTVLDQDETNLRQINAAVLQENYVD